MPRLFGRRRDEPPGDGDPPERPRAERPGELPPDGPAAVGDVSLPAGRRVSASFGAPGPDVLWRTDSEPPRAFQVWRRVALRFPETGLWPVLLERADLDLDLDEDWPVLAARDAGELIAEHWAADCAADDELAETLGPFRGLGRGGDRRADAVEAVFATIAEVQSLALVPVTRPADVPAAIGWMGPVNSWQEIGLLSAILRSWEERYDAIVVGLGFDTLYLAVRRPPQGEEALKAAGELYVACADIVDQGVGSIEALVEQVVTRQVWPFWWD